MHVRDYATVLPEHICFVSLPPNLSLSHSVILIILLLSQNFSSNYSPPPPFSPPLVQVLELISCNYAHLNAVLTPIGLYTSSCYVLCELSIVELR